MYRQEEQTGEIISYFTLLAILIASLGIFGLVSFTAERRRKEISIRKIVGAKVFNIIFMLSVDFIKLVITAILLAVPISYYFMSRWLDNFAYRINIDPSFFLQSAGLAIAITTFTVSFQAVKAATANPVNSLREE